MQASGEAVTTDKERQERVYATISKEFREDMLRLANAVNLPLATIARLSMEEGWPAVKERFGKRQ